MVSKSSAMIAIAIAASVVIAGTIIAADGSPDKEKGDIRYLYVYIDCHGHLDEQVTWEIAERLNDAGLGKWYPAMTTGGPVVAADKVPSDVTLESIYLLTKDVIESRGCILTDCKYKPIPNSQYKTVGECSDFHVITK